MNNPNFITVVTRYSQYECRKSSICIYPQKIQLTQLLLMGLFTYNSGTSGSLAKVFATSSLLQESRAFAAGTCRIPKIPNIVRHKIWALLPELVGSVFSLRDRNQRRILRDWLHYSV
jgi:hypothetical protein